jgi:hypothetical protein
MVKKRQHIHQKEDAFIIDPHTLDPAIINYLEFLRIRGERNNYVLKAIRFMDNYENHKKGFLIRMIQENYTACKHFLRMIGASKKLEVENATQNSKNSLQE